MKLLKKARRLLGVALSLVMMLTLFMWNGVEAEAAIVENVTVSEVQKYDSGFLKSFKLLKKGETAEYEKYCAYCAANELSDKYNFQTYTDLLH